MEYNAKDKYYGMKRSYERLKKINTGSGNSISNADPKDATEDFFNQCYHFNDWLKKDFSVSLTEDVENSIGKSNSHFLLDSPVDAQTICATYTRIFALYYRSTME